MLKNRKGAFIRLHSTGEIPDLPITFLFLLVPQEKYLESLHQKAEGQHIHILPSASNEKINEVLSTARVFWQLTGLEVSD